MWNRRRLPIINPFKIVERKFHEIKAFIRHGTFFLYLFLLSAPQLTHICKKVNFHVWTTNYTDHTELNVWLEAIHCTSKNPPDFVKSITITAPDGTVFNMDPVDDWLPYDRGYYSKYLPKILPHNRYLLEITL